MSYKRTPIRSWADLFAVPNFVHGQLEKLTMITGHVVDDYDMPSSEGHRPCGISNCSQGHGKGFVIELPDERISHIGRVCGSTQFGVAWSEKIKTFRAAVAADAKIEALRQSKEAGTSAIMEASGATYPRLEWALSRLIAFSALPRSITESLESRAQGNDPDVIGFRKPTVEEIARAEKKKQRPPRSVQYTIGRLDALTCLRAQRRVDNILDVQLPATIQALSKLVQSDTSTADEITAAMRLLRDVRRRLAESIDGTLRFFADANLSLIVHLPAAQRLGVKYVRVLGDIPCSIDLGLA